MAAETQKLGPDHRASNGKAKLQGSRPSVPGVPFTQYLLPNGRTRVIHIDRPPEIETLALEVMERGGRFECEILTTDEVSVTCVGEVDGEEQDVAIEVCFNGPEVPNAVDRVIRAAHAALAKSSGEGA
jgi:hypothetical protein